MLLGLRVYTRLRDPAGGDRGRVSPPPRGAAPGRLRLLVARAPDPPAHVLGCGGAAPAGELRGSRAALRGWAADAALSEAVRERHRVQGAEAAFLKLSVRALRPASWARRSRSERGRLRARTRSARPSAKRRRAESRSVSWK